VTGFLGGVAVVVALLLVNGGYVYKTTCPLASGGSQSSWTYGINDIIPYIRKTSPPCRSHTGTRLALSGIGIWPLGHGTKAETLTTEDQKAVRSLQVATAEITREYARERRFTAALRREARAKGVTPAIRAKIARGMSDTIAALQAIKDKLDRPIQASDAQLIDARTSLSTWLAYQLAIDKLFTSSSSYQQWVKRANGLYGAKLDDVIARLRYLSVVIQARFPQVNDWSFLPAK